MIAQHVFRIHAIHRSGALGVVERFFRQPRAIVVRPCVEGGAIEEQVAHGRIVRCVRLRHLRQIAERRVKSARFACITSNSALASLSSPSRVSASPSFARMLDRAPEQTPS